MTTRLIVGCGYVGERVAKKWLQAKDRVFAFTRCPNRKLQLEQLGVTAIVWDWMDSAPPRDSNWQLFLEEVPSESSLLISVSHAQVPGIPPEQTHAAGLMNLMEMLPEFEHQRLVYLSTTGVYGVGSPEMKLSLVDEQTPTSPDRPGSIAALHAEMYLQKTVPSRIVVLRPAGIYGPDRLPNWQSLRDQKPIFADPNSFLNLIHIDDLVSIIDAVSNRPMRHSLYCVSDNEPVMRQNFYNELARVGGWNKPRFEPSAIPSQANSAVPPPKRASGNKRIDNTRIVQELGYVFLFPTYREGLRSLFGENVGCYPAAVT